jgi:S1-C subfamily serine protease
MQIFDVVLLVGLGISGVRGYQIGFVRQAFSTVGFAAGSLLGSKLAPWLSARAHTSDQLAPTLLLLCVLGLGIVGMLLGENGANRLKRYGKGASTRQFDALSGVVVAVLTFIIGVWIAGVLLALAPATGLQTSAANSQVLRSIERTMPSATQFLSGMNTIIGGGDTPEVFVGSEPSPDATQPLPSLADLTTASLKARDTVVKIEGIGCGGIVDGSGFFISSRHVVTNAHVVAGVSSPKIVLQGRPTASTLVWFDPENDLAVLKTSDSYPQYLQVADRAPEVNSPVLIVGYPRGGSRVAQPGNVTARIKAIGKDIYGQAESIRDVLSLQASIVQGNSGGPVLDREGRVAGVVFATSTTYNNIGYAIAIDGLRDALRAAQLQAKPLATPACSLKAT